MINCIAIDNDRTSLDALNDYTVRIPFLDLRKTFDNAFDAFEFLEKESIDLVFTNIEMPLLNGLDFLGSLRQKYHVIIISEHDRYAVEAFNLEVTDYLLKPVLFERFLRAVNKVRENIRIKKRLSISVPSEVYGNDCIFIKSDYKTIRIDVGNILFIEGVKDYVKIHTTDRPILSLMSLRSLEQILSSEFFCRVHRSYIVAIKKIDIIEKSRIRIGQHSIAISEMYRDCFMKKIQPLKS